MLMDPISFANRALQEMAEGLVCNLSILLCSLPYFSLSRMNLKLPLVPHKRDLSLLKLMVELKRRRQRKSLLALLVLLPPTSLECLLLVVILLACCLLSSQLLVAFHVRMYSTVDSRPALGWGDLISGTYRNDILKWSQCLISGVQIRRSSVHTNSIVFQTFLSKIS